MKTKSLFLFVVCSFIFFGATNIASAQSEYSEQENSSSELASDWYVGKLVKSVSFKGLKNVESKDVDGIGNSFIGKKFTDDMFAELIDKVYALELFEDVIPSAVPGDSKRNTVSIVFTVTERPSISRITINGNRKIRTAEIRDKMSIKEKDIFKSDKVIIAEREVRSYYLEKGYTNVKVSSSTSETEKGIVINFNIDEGRETVITSIQFVGNKVMSSKTLKGKIKLKEAGVIFGKGAFQESMIEPDKAALVEFYMNKGYMDAAVIDVKKEINVNEEKKCDELTITFYIQEGPEYTYTGISFIGNEIFTDEQLLDQMTLRPNDTFNLAKLQKSFQNIADLYYGNGYTSNRFQQIPSKDPDAKTVFYTMNIAENVRSHVEHITIKGNEKTREDVILREIQLESGDIFSNTKLMSSWRNLMNLQYFGAVQPDVVPGSEENLVDVVFNVEEQSTTSIEFGVTFSGVSDPDDLPFALFAKWQDSNLRGSGRNLALSTTIATDEQSISLSLSDNWFLGLPFSASVSTSFSHSNLTAYRLGIDGDGVVSDDDYYMDYQQWRWSLGFSIGRRWIYDWAILSWGGGINGSLRNNVYDSDLWIPVDTSVSEYANKWGWQNSIWTSLSVDDRDINFDPSSGWFASQRLAWYGLTPIETEYFLKTDTKLEKYFTLFDWHISETYDLKFVLAAYTNLSMLFPAANTGIGDTSKLYIDGMFNGRGWTNIYKKVRGKALWSSNIELRVPVVPGVLAIDIFGDAAAVKDEVNDLFTNLSAEDFYFSVGPGIRFTIPQFPLRLLFANTFKVDDGSMNWHDKWKFVLSFNITNK